MKRRAWLAGVAFLSLGASAAQGDRLEIITSLGVIIVEVDSAAAPITASNFLRYADERLFDGGSFHRTVTAESMKDSPVKIEVIQAGIADKARAHPPIELETTQKTGLRTRPARSRWRGNALHTARAASSSSVSLTSRNWTSAAQVPGGKAATLHSAALWQGWRWSGKSTDRSPRGRS